MLRMLAATLQMTDEADDQAVVEHRPAPPPAGTASPSCVVGVTSGYMKLKPLSVTEPPALATTFLGAVNETAGASKVKWPTLVPITAEMVKESRCFGPEPCATRHCILVVVNHDAVLQIVCWIDTVSVMSRVPKFRPASVKLVPPDV